MRCRIRNWLRVPLIGSKLLHPLSNTNLRQGQLCEEFRAHANNTEGLSQALVLQKAAYRHQRVPATLSFQGDSKSPVALFCSLPVSSYTLACHGRTLQVHVR